MDKKVLITGGTGFAGSHLVEYLLEKSGFEIHVTSYGTAPTTVSTLLPTNRIHKLDITNEAETAQLIKELQPDHIYHLAAIATVADSFTSPARSIVTNTLLQISILEAIRKHAPMARTLIIGSAQEYDFIGHDASGKITEDHPLGAVSPYGVSKIDQDLLALSYFYSYNLQVIRVRPFNHIGELQTEHFAIASFAKQIAEAEKNTPSGQTAIIKVGNMSAVRDFTDVKDMVRAYALLMEKGIVGEVYNIGSGVGYSMQEVLDMLVAKSTAKISVETDPERMRPLDVPSIIADISKMKALGWSPTIPLETTLGRVLTYWRAQK